MKNALVIIFLSQIISGCAAPPKTNEYIKDPRPTASLSGRASGKPMVLYYQHGNSCGTASLSYEHNLKDKADMRALQDVTLPKWGLPFKFEAFYYHENYDCGYTKYYIVTNAYALSKTPESKCFELVFEKSDDGEEEMCYPEQIVENLKKWFIPNQVTFRDPKKIIKAAHQLPMTLVGCFENKNLDIVLSLKEAVTK